MALPRTLHVVILFASLAAMLSGCVKLQGTAREVASPQRSSEATTAIDWGGSHGDRVLMLGREFARDWYMHWGGRSGEPIARDGVSVFFADLEREPKDAAAIRKHIIEAPKGVVVFYMAGPDALAGGSPKASSASVDRLLAEVDQVIAGAKARGLKVVVGGPLPSLPSDTDRPLVDAQRRYAKELRSRESKGRLKVFDAYEHMSTAGDVTLVRGYALTQADSRLGPAGFEALDERCFAFVAEMF